MKKGTLLLICLLSLAFMNLRAQNSIEVITTEFFDIFERDPMMAFDFAFSTNKWMERNMDGVESVKIRFKEVIPLIGNYNGYEKLVERNLGESLRLVSFNAKYDRQPIRITFVFYKPDQEWQVQNLKWDGDLVDSLDAMAFPEEPSN